MPFTFSHPAAIIPAKLLPEKWISMTALVIGSVTPDFEYFIRMKNLSKYSHTWVGMFWYDLPIAFLLAFVYHYFVRDSLIDNLPGFLRKRLTRFKNFNWTEYVGQHFWVVLVCFLVGIASHIAWDGFTHRMGYFVVMYPWLAENTYRFGIGQTRFYVLQQASSLLGMVVVLFAIFKTPQDKSVETRSILKYWVVVAIIALTIASARILLGFKWVVLVKTAKELCSSGFVGAFFNHGSASDIIMACISAFLISLIITPYIIGNKGGASLKKTI